MTILVPQISELTSELADERNTGESASQLLDAEAAERLRAEKEMKELQVRSGGSLAEGAGQHILPFATPPIQSFWTKQIRRRVGCPQVVACKWRDFFS